MDVPNTTDENDDVASFLDISQFNDRVDLALSGVGPFASLIHQDEDERYVWVTEPDQRPTPLARAVAAHIVKAGFLLLPRDLVTRTVKMNRRDESTEATLYQALSTDIDRIP